MPPIIQTSNKVSAIHINQRIKMKKVARALKYEQKVSKCEEFLKNFEDYEMGDVEPAYEQYGRRKYMIKLQQLANQKNNILSIYIEDLESYFRKDDEKELVEGFKNNTIRYIKIFQKLADSLMPARNIDVNPDNQIRYRFDRIISEQRRDNMSSLNPLNANQLIPSQTSRNFDVVIIYGTGSKIKLQSISDFHSDRIGGLIACKAIVIRVTEVRPQLVIGVYACDTCGCENYYEVNNDHFGPLVKCQSKICIQNGTNGKLSFLPGHSKFINYQQMKIQETPDQLQQGKIPKSFMVQVRGNLVKQATPGDNIIVQGILVAARRKGHENDLNFQTHLLASDIIRQKKKYVEMHINQERKDEIQKVRNNLSEDEIYQKMARSIAPEIYGLQNVKKALLLLMAGGVTKITNDNLKIRGEINIALFGDPGIAKSQLLKHISFLAPRGVYTTGKGSSGVGLTAAVVKDPYTQQLALEAGALVLADMGVCCIDEFDKMQEYDRTAIHEVMEQQTISIAKAGITTTLNARTSILAAANPVYGRYNKMVSPHKNINMPAALMSRFDLIFILLDSCEQGRDIDLAKHIGNVHRLGKAPIRQSQIFSPEFIRAYVAMAKSYEPILTEELHAQIIQRYISKRQEQMDLSKDGENYTTMRSLLALLRLAQARARLRFSDEISKTDIEEGLLLIEESQSSVSNVKLDKKGRLVEDVHACFGILKDLAKYSERQRVQQDILLKRILAKGYTEQKYEEMLQQYTNLNVIMRVDDQKDNKRYIMYIDTQN